MIASRLDELETDALPRSPPFRPSFLPADVSSITAALPTALLRSSPSTERFVLLFPFPRSRVLPSVLRFPVGFQTDLLVPFLLSFRPLLQKKIVIYAKTNIEAGDEITYDYHFPIEQEKVSSARFADLDLPSSSPLFFTKQLY